MTFTTALNVSCVEFAKIEYKIPQYLFTIYEVLCDWNLIFLISLPKNSCLVLFVMSCWKKGMSNYTIAEVFNGINNGSLFRNFRFEFRRYIEYKIFAIFNPKLWFSKINFCSDKSFVNCFLSLLHHIICLTFNDSLLSNIAVLREHWRINILKTLSAFIEASVHCLWATFLLYHQTWANANLFWKDFLLTREKLFMS